MNKTAIKNFAVWARRKLIADITYRAGMLGITESRIAQPMQQSTKDLQFFDIGTKDYVEISGEEIQQRNALIAAIRRKEGSTNYKEAFQNVVEEVAYTWFNRLIAVRFMEVNDYLPSRVRVLSAENPNKLEPDFVTTPFDTDMEFTPYEKDRVLQLKEDNKLDELFRFLFIKQCNKLGEILPELFERISDYTELLLNISFTDKDGVIYHLTHDIEEDDFNVSKEGQVEIIGWMYQYYNTEPKDEVFALLKKNVKITKERIPAATQLFTPDWIVRYMVENSLGRLWVEGHPNRGLKSGWKYYLEEVEQEPEVAQQLDTIRAEYAELNPEDIKVIDPCMGSGHILVYAFDVLMQIYHAQGYTQRDAAKSILKNNLYGIDIDTRAYQLAYFAVMMKARQYNRRIFNEHIMPNLMAVKNTGTISKYALKRLGEHEKLAKRLMDDFTDAEEYGSILDIHYSVDELDALSEKLISINEFEDIPDLLAQMECGECKFVLEPLVRQARIMGLKYDIVVTNPPYMGASNMNAKLCDFIKQNYSEYKSDFFSAFVVKCSVFAKKNGFCGFLTPYVWMFIQSYEKMREYLYSKTSTETLIQFEYSAFEEATVPICAFVYRNNFIKTYKGCYLRLTDFRGGMEVQKNKTLEAISNHGCGYYYEQSNDSFGMIPGSPIAYWVGSKVGEIYTSYRTLDSIADVRHGLSTGKNDLFVRSWAEVCWNQVDISLVDRAGLEFTKGKFFPYNKGGEFRKWYGNADFVVWYDLDGQAKMKSLSGHRHDGKDRYFQEGITWSFISSSNFGVRYTPSGFVFDVAGSSMFFNGMEIKYITGLLCSKLGSYFMSIQNPTMNFQVGNLKNVPVIIDKEEK